MSGRCDVDMGLIRWPARYMASTDPEFEEKAADYWLVPQATASAAVFCVDEKSAIQALDRLDPVLPFARSRRTTRL